MGKSVNIVIVLPAALVSAKLKCMESCTALPFAAAWVSASLKVPGPESALLVTTKVAGNALRQKKISEKKNKIL